MMNWYKKAQKIYTKFEMISMGADGGLLDAILLMIPINKITGREPKPADYVDESGKVRQFQKGNKVVAPIEVTYDNHNDVFILYGGNHRLRQAEINGDKLIKAFVEAEDIDIYTKLASEYELV